MATQTNLLGYFGKTISRKRKLQSNITSFFNKKTDLDEKDHDDDVIYVGAERGNYCIKQRESFPFMLPNIPLRSL